MANSNKVFVSPGVYTSEKDLTFVAQSVGVTTLGLVGETLKGPAFEPILISNFDEFRTYFGTTSPEKDGLGNPKYELAYVAKSYLQESNQLFVTRILGLTGYKPNKSFGIKTIGGVVYDSESITTTDGVMLLTYPDVENFEFYDELSGKTATNGESIIDNIINLSPSYTDGDWFTIGLVPSGYTSGFTGNQITSPIGDYTNKNWFNVYYNELSSKLYAYLFTFHSGDNSGQGQHNIDPYFDVIRIEYDANRNEYDGITVALLRSRGSYVGETLNLSITENSGFTIESDELSLNPMAEFVVNFSTDGGVNKTYTCSMNTSSTKYISKVLGNGVFDKDKNDFPLYVYEIYPTYLKYLYNSGLIAGLSTDIVYHTVNNDFLTDWDTPSTPMVVSEVRGGSVADLFLIDPYQCS